MPNLAFNVDTTDCVRLSYQGAVDDNDIVLNYHTMNNSNPKQNKDIIAFYESDLNGYVIPGARSEYTIEVDKEAADNSILLPEVPRKTKSYVFAYIQGSSLTEVTSRCFEEINISCLLTLPKKATGGSSYCISLNINSKGDIVILNYTGIPNTQPQNKAWIGIWRNKNLKLTAPPDIYYPISEPDPTGNMQIDDLLVNTNYYLGYFLCGYSTKKDDLKTASLAACIKFTTTF